jgi:phage replication-related protein YjqB (UPF0714/DUF867 family)
MSSYNARIIPSSNIPNAPIREHCSAHHSQITTIGRIKGQQVRVGRYAPDGVTLADFALYTVSDLHEEEPDTVFVGFREPESEKHDLRDRLGLSDAYTFGGKIDSQVPHPTYTDAEAEANSEFVERLTDNGRHRGLIAIAPHGGDIERHADEQAERVGKQLSAKCVSAWVCKGFKQGGGAFDRWHITSTDINEESFPKLKTVIGRHFEYAVAFHGWSEDSICIGGSAPPALKLEIKAAVEKAISGSGIVVATSDEGTCPAAFNGDDPNNIVNRLGANGIQLEQSKEARASYGVQIADAVADVLGPKIKVCVAPVFKGSNAWACLFKSLGYSALAILLGRAPSVTCEIKRLLFRIRNCRGGNTDPCIEL